MSHSDPVTIELDETIHHVWAAVVDAAGYPDWLIGAQEVEVPESWPCPGAAFEHRIGFGPFRIPGSTTVRTIDEPTWFAISAGMGVLGEAEVTFELVELGPRRTRVTMTERPVEGIVGGMYRFGAPVLDRVIRARNTASLEQLGAGLG